jgi:predicted permease
MFSRLRSFFRKRLERSRKHSDADLDAEIRGYADLLADEKIRAGMHPDQAQRAARLALGGGLDHASLTMKETIREARPGAWLDSFAQDVRYGARLLRKSPGFTIIAVLTLGLGIGASTALFSVWQAALVFPYAFEMNGKWIAILGGFDRQQASSWYFSSSEFADLQKITDVFDDVLALQHVNFNLTDSGRPEFARATAVTANALRATHVEPLLGRVFLRGEDSSSAPNVVVIGDRLWQRRYQRDPQIIGRSMRLNGQTYTIVGVMPPRFLLWGTDMWVPLHLDPNDRNRSNRTYWVTAMVKPGVSMKQVNARLAVAAHQWEADRTAATPEYANLRLWAVDILSVINEPLRDAMLVLLAAIALLLTITCANVANLLLSRAHARRREVAVRLALGARRGHIIRQLLTESVILSALGGAFGFLLAWWGVPLIGSMIIDYSATEAGEFRIDQKAFWFMLVLSLFVGVFCGLVPAFHAAEASLIETLKTAGKQSGSGHRGKFSRRVLVGAETCLALIVLVAAGLMIRSYARLSASSLGLSPDHVTVVHIPLPPAYPTQQEVNSFYESLQSQVAAIPGTSVVGLASSVPISDRLDRQDFHVVGRAANSSDGTGDTVRETVSSNYFAALRIPIKAGRAFSDGDREGNRNVVIVNEAMAKRYWPAVSPVGQEIELGNQFSENFSAAAAPSRLLIVGVAGDTRQERETDREILPEFYIPFLQSSSAIHSMNLLVRSGAAEATVTESVRNIVARLDPALPVGGTESMDEIVRNAYGTERLALVLLSVFAGAALIIAMAGIYAVLAYDVARQTHEIGIRMALGARRSDVLRVVMGAGLKPALAGAVVGLVAALAGTRVMNALLYGVAPWDPLTFACVAALLFLVAALACWIPARRAMRVDPVVALRHE